MSDVLREGDIFRWRWTPEKEAAILKFHFSSYWCRSQIATVRGGVLYDTFWSTQTSDYALRPEDVILDFQGNPADMVKISEHERTLYRPEDIVDMRHPNNSGAPVYVKAGAARDAQTMLAFYRYEIEQEQSAIRSAQRHIEEFEEAVRRINGGDLGGSFPIYSRGRR